MNGWWLRLSGDLVESWWRFFCFQMESYLNQLDILD